MIHVAFVLPGLSNFPGYWLTVFLYGNSQGVWFPDPV